MANDTNYIGVAMGFDVTDLKAGISEANKQIQLANSQFKSAASGMDDWTKSTEGLQAKVKQLDTVLSAQKSKLAGLEAEYAKVAAEQGENSEAARKLQVQINNQKAVVNATQREFDNYTDTLAQAESGTIDLEDVSLKNGKAIEKAGDSAKEAGGKFEGLKSISSAVAGGIAAIGAAAVGVVGGFLALAESTRESRNEMAKLDTAFQTAELSADSAKSTFTTLYGVMGDEGAAVEAAQQLAKISKDEKDLTANTRILTGVMAEYGNSIPLEGLAEGMAATASMGSVQGVLADALEWQGVNLDDFNAKLATMATEEERAAYIQETLTGLYGESADAYRENNAEVIAAQEAQAKLNSVLNELGAIAEPIMTTIKTLGASLLETILPFVELIGEGLSGALNGTAGSTDKLAEGIGGVLNAAIGMISDMLPSVISVIGSLIPTILQTISAQAPQVLSTIGEFLPMLVTAILNMLPSLLQTILGLITQIITTIADMIPTIIASIMEILPQLINSLIAAIPQLLEAAITLLMALVDAIPVIITALIEALPTIIQTLIDALITAIPMLLEAAIQLLNTLVEAIPVIIQSLVENLPTIIDTIINGIIEAIPLLLEGAITFLMAIIDAIPVIVQSLVENMPEIITTIITALVDAFPKLLETAGELFGQLLTAAWDLIKKLPEVLGSIISTIVDFLVSPFKDMFGGMWEGLKNGAKNAWEGVKSIFSSVAKFFGDIFGNAWSAVKKVFSAGGEIFAGIKDGIVNAFKTVVNAIIKGINKVVKVPFDAINGVLKKIKGIDIMGLKPFDWIKTFNVPQIPELEEGGVLKKGQVGLLEGKGAEAVVPLEKNLGWIKKIATEISKMLSFDVSGVKNGISAINRNAVNGTTNNTTSKQTVIDARQTINYNGNLSRKQLKQLENDNYTAIKLRLQAEGAI